VGFSGDAVVEYSLSTAWDISSASFVTSLSVNAQEPTPRSFWFKGDGSEVYVSGTITDSVHQYSLSTTWDVSSGTYTQSFSIAAQSGLPRGLTFKPDGTKMYVADTSTDRIYQYSLSSAWDISTASYDSKTLTPGTPTATSPRFNPDGTKLWLIDSGPDEVAQYSLTTAWDVSLGLMIMFSLMFRAKKRLHKGFSLIGWLQDVCRWTRFGHHLSILHGVRTHHVAS
jgi:DNA-binding beta-propeller fold protein YncE